ncbi:hypothetical protein BAUCODRAFT_120104 [Baudoinia panamericana UAMH 10762]|uniref:Nucleolar complex protein 2 n=1 Tax=Baudoinia panamericana (strain UAMH 10762) TaxID=717646 RepID=M2N486_BAUPA|nr:uncharacterized protein BAUCODRAFT_120104 [Baudoinia panamericana UAMH 10762]EMC98803.1 hypothetical protein BAUCODRAFT_120104 [Baudoinia panamericana UAMH 10762]
MAQSKATKKFEKRHLKDTLEKRNGLKKTKQKQQLKARKKARRAEEEGRDGRSEDKDAQAQSTTAKARAKAASGQDAFKDMSVDDFFQGGFEVPELPKQKGSKRKRQEAEDDADERGDDEEAGEADSEDEDDVDDHRQQLDALAENDPEFHKYLQENEPELLDAELAEIGELSEDDNDDDQPKRKKRKSDATDTDASDNDETDGIGNNDLDMPTLTRWQKALTDHHSLRAAKELVLAFRSAAHVSEASDDNTTQKTYKYSISSPTVYHALLTTALTQIPQIFAHHLPPTQTKSGKSQVQTASKKFKTLAPLLRSHIASILHLLSHLSDAATLRLTLSSTLPLLPYLLSFKKLVRDLARSAATVWSTASNAESVRVGAFLILRRLVVMGDAGIRENVLKAAYQALIMSARNTTIHTLPGVNLMKNSGAELWGVAASEGDGVAYTTAFTFIRQLAIHLRTSIANPGNESYKTVYNWQYIHGLDFWSRVLASHTTPTDSKSSSSTLRPLIYPLVQLTLGALRLIPTATYFPLRFHLIRSCLRISVATGTYIPLAPALYEVLNSAEMRRTPKSSTLKPLDFATSIRAPGAYLRTRTYQDGVGEQVVELFAEFFGLYAKNLAFPELSLAPVVALKRWLKDVQARGPGKGNRNQKVNSAVQVLVQKVEANSRWVEERRRKVEFAPDDRRGVEGFLAEVEWEKSPLGAYVVGLRRGREERVKVVEEGRRREEVRERAGKGGKGRDAGRARQRGDRVEEEEGVDGEEDEGEDEGEDGEDGLFDGIDDDDNEDEGSE